MKYKHKLIQQVKNKYGVPELHFFKGYRYSKSDEHYTSPGSGHVVVICSLDYDLDKTYKENKDICIEARLTHTELESILQTLAENSRYEKNHWPTIHSPVLLEPYGIEANDLISLKSAYLLTYLSGI